MLRDNPTRWNSAYKLLDRAIYLRKAIEKFLDDETPKLKKILKKFKLTKTEWDQAEFMLNILLPFEACSARLEATTRPGIAKVFWVYESLFNEIDRLTTIMKNHRSAHHKWLKASELAFDSMSAKLRKYYKDTENQFVYPDAVIFQPRSKLALFQQKSWEAHHIKNYSTGCRERFLTEYQSENRGLNQIIGHKRGYAEIDIDDDDDEYEKALRSLNSVTESNEYDRYVESPTIKFKISELDYWREASKQEFTQLGMMIRDTLAVPATGAGVEREFSLAGHVVTRLRSRLGAGTIEKIMMYKNHLIRCRKELKSFEAAGLGAGEEPMENSASESEVPKEWRDQWWVKRKRMSCIP